MRRLALIALLMFWLGGFTFYTAIVVPLGTEVLGSSVEQGFITREVTRSLNGWGVIAAAAWGLELWKLRTIERSCRLRWTLWLFVAACLAGLFVVHPVLDGMMDHANRAVHAVRRFRRFHRVYLWLSTVQWFAAVWLLERTLAAWSLEDRRRAADSPGLGPGSTPPNA